MALQNPITSDDLTIDFSELLKIPVSSRVQAAMLDQNFSNAVMTSLTPIQAAKAFPDYYRKELPDISNFILGNRYLDKGGAFDQRGGGNYGKGQKGYKGEVIFNPKEKPAPPRTVVDKILEKTGILKTSSGGVKRSPGSPGELGFAQNTTIDPRKRALLDAIATDSGGGYGTINYLGAQFIGSETKDFSQHPFQDPNKRNLTKYRASGRYQITLENYERFARKLGLHDESTGKSDFSPEAQDLIAYEMAKDVYSKGTGGRNLDEDINDPNISPDQLIRPLSIDYGWWILKDEPGMEKAKKVFTENEKIYFEDAKTAAEAAANEPKEDIKVSSELTDILNKSPIAEKYFLEDNPDMGQKLQQKVNSGEITIDELKKMVDSRLDELVPLEKTPDVNLENVDPRLVEVVTAGAARLPPGYKVYISEGYTQLGHAEKSQHKIEGRGALDVHIVGPDGQEIPNKGADYTGMYKLLGQHVYGEMKARYPELDGQLSHGAAFGTVRGGNVPDLMHFDLGGERGQLGPTLSQIGPVEGELYGQKPESSTATATEDKSPAAKKTMVISLGTNDWADPSKTYDNSLATIKAAQEKGYNVVVVPPVNAKVGDQDFQPVSAEVRRAAADAGVELEEVQDWSGTGGYHPSNEEAKRIAAKRPDAVYVGDSIANQMGTFAEKGSKIATDGIGTEAILQNVTSDQVASFRTGGSPNTQDDENLSVYDENGSLRWKMNSGEGIYVKPEANEYADDKIAELSGRVSEMDEKITTQYDVRKKSKTPDSAPKKNWQQDIANMVHSPGTQGRAFRRTKFQNEGFHWGRSSPNSVNS